MHEQQNNAGRRRRIRALRALKYLMTWYFLLIAIALTFSGWLPDSVREHLASAFGVTDQFLPHFGSVFVILSLLIFVSLDNILMHIDTARRIRAFSDMLNSIMGVLERLVDPKEEQQLVEYKTELGSLRRKLEDVIAERVQEAESRLRSEWRFVLMLIVATLLAVIALFAP